MKDLNIVVLAAGKGTRMEDESRPKVLVPFMGKEMLGHVLDSIEPLAPTMVVPIVGYMKESVEAYVKRNYSNDLPIKFAYQLQQLGTGHAVIQTKEILAEREGDTLILCGDVPNIKTKTLQDFINGHRASGSVLSVMSATAPNPTGYGRIVKDDKGQLLKIVEQKDASDSERLIDEINSGIYLVDNRKLFAALDEVGNENSQREYYLTDIVSILKKRGEKITVYHNPDFLEIVGVNSKNDLKDLESKVA